MPQPNNNMFIVCYGCQDQNNHIIQPRPHVDGCLFKADKGLVNVGPQLVQTFNSGATRSADTGKNKYLGFLSFQAIEAFGDYMTRHRVQADGSLREPDNWKKGITIESYMDSLLRHALEMMGLSVGYIPKRCRLENPSFTLDQHKLETACAIFFNVQGFLHEFSKDQITKQQLSKLQEDFYKQALNDPRNQIGGAGLNQWPGIVLTNSK